MKALYLCLFNLFILNQTFAVGIEQNNLFNQYENKNSAFKFNYFLNFTGPALANKKFGETYDRFETGYDDYGLKRDPNNSFTLFHAIEYAYQLNINNMVSWSMAFTARTQNNVEYKYKSKKQKINWNNRPATVEKTTYEDVTAKRNSGTQLLNQRLNLSTNNIINNKFIILNNKSFYEFPTTKSSIDNGMQFGIGAYPQIAIKSNNLSHSYGILGKFEFYSFDKNYTETLQDKTNCYFCDNYYDRKRTAIISIGHYYNYFINDTYQIKTTTNFDWDQKGEDTGTTNFTKNLDDIFDIGIEIRSSKNTSFTPYMLMAIEEPSLDKMVLGAKLTINL